MATTHEIVDEYTNWEEEVSEKQKRAKKKANKPTKKHKMKNEEDFARNNFKKQKTQKYKERDIKRMMRDY